MYYWLFEVQWFKTEMYWIEKLDMRIKFFQCIQLYDIYKIKLLKDLIIKKKL